MEEEEGKKRNFEGDRDGETGEERKRERGSEQPR